MSKPIGRHTGIRSLRSSSLTASPTTANLWDIDAFAHVSTNSFAHPFLDVTYRHKR